MNATLPDMFRRHAAPSFDKQLHLSELVGEEDWHFNMASGLLSFGQDLRFQAQVLGTESDHDHTWLWAWANEGSNIPPSLLQAALQMRTLGEAQRIPELTQPEFALGAINGHFLSMIASGVCQANAYFRAPNEGGAAFLLIKDDRFPKNTDPPLQRIAQVFPEAIASIAIPDHKLALIGHLEYYGLPFTDLGSEIIVGEGSERMLTATFDYDHRLTQLDVVIPHSG